MAEYTVTIRDLIANHFDLGLRDYPIYEESYRNTLNTKILNHYLMREIGAETPELFKVFLNNTMNEIMPKYNLLYQALEEYKDKSLLSNVTITETQNYDSQNNLQNNSKDTIQNGYKKDGDVSINNQLYQDTPQGELSKTDIDDQKWATNLTQQKNVNKSDSFVETIRESGYVNDHTGNDSKVTVGNNGSLYGVEVLEKIAKSKTNIDLQIIDELNDLFMGLY